MEGIWELEWDSKGNTGNEFAKFNKIDSSYLYSNHRFNNYEPIFEIKGVFINEKENILQFTKYELDTRIAKNSVRRVLFNDLRISKTVDKIVLTGTENGELGTIKYTKSVIN